MYKTARDLIEIGDKMFQRDSLMSLWQDIAENFLPERAHFSVPRSLGDEFASSLMTGFPALQLRELSDQLAGMLRPRQTLWAKIVATDERRNDDTEARAWLEWASERFRRAMYAPRAQFLRATKIADLDFAAFGQAVILPSLNKTRDGLLHRTYHLKDCAWYEDLDGEIEHFQRKDMMCVREILRYFPKTAHETVRELNKKEPYKEFEIRHIVLPADQFEGSDKVSDEFKFYSCFVDVEHQTILEKVPRRRIGYVVPRWRLGAFKQYAVSPVTMLALPDARMLQAMTMALLEAGEKSANPPTVATIDAVRSDMQVYAGGTTWVDRMYDEREGAALRTMEQDYRGLPYAHEMLAGVREQMHAIFFLNKINLPEVSLKEMTAFETRKRVEQYVRSALPLFEPMEVEYNGRLCNEDFAIMLENNGFGPAETMPESLQGADVRFEFISPLQQTAERAKVQAYMEAAQIGQIAAQIDPEALLILDTKKATREALEGAEVPADWMYDEEYVQQKVEYMRQQMAQQQQMQEAQQIAESAGKAAPMVQALNGPRQ